MVVVLPSVRFLALLVKPPQYKEQVQPLTH
jgi:hypothetical protein